MDRSNNLSQDVYVLPVSSGQENLWFLHRLDDKLSSAYNIPTALKINTVLNRIVLQKAVNKVVSRHEALRTGFSQINGVLKQIVDPNLMITVSYLDYTNEKLGADAAIFKKMQDEAARPFVLSSPGLIRFSLYRANPSSFYLLIVLHHTIADGASLEILIREIVGCYQKILANEEVSLPELTYQFADITAWQNENVITKFENKYIDYWKEKLSAVNTVIELSESKKRVGIPSFAGETLPFSLNPEVFKKFSYISQETQVSPYCILLSAFALLTHYYSGLTDFLIGTPTLNRDQKEAWDLVGYFANTVVIRVNFDSISCIKDLLLQVHSSISEALFHQHLSISKIVELIQPERTNNLGTIFQLMFSYQESPQSKSILDDFNAEKILIDNTFAKFDIFLFLLNQNNSLDGYLEYSTEIFEREYMLGLIQHYVIICNTLQNQLSGSLYQPELMNGLTKEKVEERIKEAKNQNLILKNKNQTLVVNRKKNTLELKLEFIWQTLLDVEIPIELDANFFEMGGNSLLVAKMVEMVHQELKILVPIKIIFLHPSLSKIAEYIETLSNPSIKSGR